MLKHQLETELEKVVQGLGFTAPTDTVISISQNPQFGDYSSNIALQLANQKSKEGLQSPLEIAKQIIRHLGHPIYLERVEIAGPSAGGGFINFFVKPDYLAQDIKEVLDQGDKFGQSDRGKGKKVQVEFISANPTGPLTLANGRGGAVGDAIGNMMELNGYQVEREYYVNDTGNQVRTLAESVLAAAGKAEKKPEHYQGEYVYELASKFADQLELETQQLGHLLADYLMENEIKPAIKKLGIKFDNFYSERSLYPDKINQALDELKAKDAVYEKDGAVWFKSEELGDEKDRVLMTSVQGRGRAEPTYFLGDIAYHLDTYARGIDKKINVWGADHHGHAIKMKKALEKIGYSGKLEVIIMQMVRLFKEGREVRMSKRAGTFVTLGELLTEVSSDVAKFFFLMYAPSTHINFNLDLAKERSEQNPVYYVQYAHARMCSILSKVGKITKADLTLLTYPQEQLLIKHLLDFPDLVTELTKTLQVHQLTSFAISTADLVNKFYEACPVLYAGNEELVAARVRLVQAARIVLANCLRLLGVSTPERM